MLASLLAAAVCCAISGRIQSDRGLPVPGAVLNFSGATSATAITNVEGTFLTQLSPGRYRVVIRAAGYGSTEINDVNVTSDNETIDATLVAISSEKLRTIGEVRVNGELAVPTGVVPNATLTRQTIELQGLPRVTSALAEVPSAMLSHPDGGNASSPVVASLRGPDPSETLVSLDGQVLNNTNTGDLDLSQLIAAPFGTVDVSEGLGPSDNSGANTIGGEVNFVSLMPTHAPHEFLQLSAGSFGSWTAAANLQGSVGRLGYALAVSRNGQAGYPNDYAATLLRSGSGSISAQGVSLGSWIDASNGLTNFIYSFSPRADIHVRYLTIQNTRDESASQNSPSLADQVAAYLNQQTVDGKPVQPGPYFVGGGPQTAAQNLQAGLIDGRVPVGSGTLSLSYSGSSSGLANQGVSETPYDFSNQDRIRTGTAQFEQPVGAATLTFGDYVRTEALSSPDQFTQTLFERSYSAFVRGEFDEGPMQIGATIYDTRYSSFGSSVDWRVGTTYRMRSGGVMRVNVGTGFRAPLLSELYVVPPSLLVADQNCVAPNGNPNEKPEHTTEYELGYGQPLGPEWTADASLWRTNLRDPIENFYPLGTKCPSSGSSVVAESFPVNVGNAVYQGTELSLTHKLGAFLARGQYAINQAYPTSLPPDFAANPTSGSNLVPNQQFAGISPHSGSLDIRYQPQSGWHADSYLIYRGKNNELNQGAYAELGAAIGKSLKDGIDLTLAGQNLTSAVSGRFTLIGAGVPYPTPIGPLPRGALFLEPAGVQLILTYHH